MTIATPEQTTIPEPKVGSGGHGDEFIHIFNVEDITRSIAFGEPITALCGFTKVLNGTIGNRTEKCPACEELRGMANLTIKDL